MVSAELHLSVLRGSLQLIRPVIALVAVLAVFAGGIVDGLHHVSPRLSLAMAAAFFMLAGANARNDYLDSEVDQQAHPERPIPSGRLPPKAALYFAYLSFALALLLSLFINMLGFGIIVAGIVLLAIYERYLKEVALAGNLLAAFFSGLAVVFGGIAVGRVYNTLPLAGMAFFVMLGREILKDVKDIKGDVFQRVTLPMAIGRKNALYLGCSAVAAATALAPFPYWLNALRVWYLVIVIPAALSWAYSLLLVLRDIQNIDITLEILRSGSALALVGFIVGAM